MFQKYATLKIAAWVDSSTRKTASTDVKVGSFSIGADRRDGMLYVATRACTADVPNLNMDMWPREELMEAANHYAGCPIYWNHDNLDTKKARGVVIDAVFHDENPNDRWLECLMEVDEQRAPKLCTLIRSGEIDTVSVGYNVSHCACNVCGNVAQTAAQYCDHIAMHKGQWFYGKQAFEICYGIDPFELSLVDMPADQQAVIQMIASRS